MSKEIVYLLGAGASANAIPVMKKLPKVMKYFLEKLIFSLRENVQLTNPIAERRRYISNLVGEIEQFGTPDIVAKIAFHKGEVDKVQNLKDLLTCFILSEQLVPDVIQALDGISPRKLWFDEIVPQIFDEQDDIEDYLIPEQLDNRYVELMSAVLTGSRDTLGLPDKLSIVSWNYDHQIEKALHAFHSAPLKKIQEHFKIFPITDVNDGSNSFEHQRLAVHNSKVIKLNGTAGYGNENSTHSLFDINSHEMDTQTIEIMGNKIFQKRSTRMEENKLAFAWEREIPRVKLAAEAAQLKIGNAEVVVVIGYTFPNFNRDVDRQIFQDFKGSKIYIQDPYPDDTIEKLDGVKKGLKNKAVAVRSGGSFTIPNEFWE